MTDSLIARDHGERAGDGSAELSRRWIVVADSPFLPATGGGEREHLGFLRAAAAEGALALVIVPSHGPLETELYHEALGPVPILATPRRTSPWRLAHPGRPFVVASRPVPRDLVAQARAAAPDATGVVGFSYKVHRIAEVLATGLGLPAVIRQHNLEGPYHRSLAQGTRGPRGLVLRLEASRIDRDDRRLGRAGWVHGIADISASDADTRRASGAPAVHVPPFAYDPTLAALQRPPIPDRRVLFLGALDIATNTTALDWLLDRVWPQVLAAVPDAVLDVVGRSPAEGLRRRLESTAGVRLHPDVPDIRPFLASAGVAVNPAVSGSGVNIKVVDYLQAGVPVVSTAHAVRGLHLVPGVHLEVQDEPAGFATAVVRLLEDTAAAAQLGERGRARIGELVDPALNLERVASLLAARTAGVAR